MKTQIVTLKITLREWLYIKHQEGDTPQEFFSVWAASRIEAQRWPKFNSTPRASSDPQCWDAEHVRNNPAYVPMRLRYDEINARIDDPKVTDVELRKLIPESVAIAEQITELWEKMKLEARSRRVAA
jgi:hypothetical protein